MLLFEFKLFLFPEELAIKLHSQCVTTECCQQGLVVRSVVEFYYLLWESERQGPGMDTRDRLFITLVLLRTTFVIIFTSDSEPLIT